MTLITLYYKKPSCKGVANGIICLADSVISTINNPESCITKQAMKILSLEFGYNFDMPEYPKLIKNEIGLAFAGNVSIAMQTYNIVRICCKNINPSNPTKHTGPSIKSVAILIGQILEHYCKCYGFFYPKCITTEFVIFGFCFVELNFKAYHIKISYVAKELTINIADVDIINIPYFAFGSGKSAFEKYIANSETPNRILNCFREFIKTDESRKNGVGGYLQKTFASRGNFRYFADFSIDESGLLGIHNAQLGGFTFNNCFLDDYLVSFGANPFLE